MKNNNAEKEVQFAVTSSIKEAKTPLELLLETSPDDDSFNEKFESFVDAECIYVKEEDVMYKEDDVFTCDYCNSPLTNHYYVDTKKNHTKPPYLQGTIYCDLRCLKGNILKEMASNGLFKNLKLDMNYLYKFGSITVEKLLDRFTKKDLLEFIDRELNINMFKDNLWNDEYRVKEDIPKEDLINDIIKTYWEI